MASKKNKVAETDDGGGQHDDVAGPFDAMLSLQADRRRLT
jgi:hypothetical protein